MVLMRVNFKFQESSSPDERRLVVEQVKALGAEEVEPMFPEETDADLVSLYKAKGIPEEQVDDVVTAISGFAGVEYAEPAPAWRMIH
jgi:hypothetical protein